MKQICWAYDDDGRICRRLAVQFDPQRGFLVCVNHSQDRAPKTPNKTAVMTKTKPPPDGAPAATAAKPTEQYEYKNVPEVDAKIDAHIKANPERWAFIQAMPRDRLERALVLSDVKRLDREQRVRDGVMQRINSNPQLKQAYETLVKNVPENQRETVMVQIARQTALQTRRVVGRGQTV